MAALLCMMVVRLTLGKLYLHAGTQYFRIFDRLPGWKDTCNVISWLCIPYMQLHLQMWNSMYFRPFHTLDLPCISGLFTHLILFECELNSHSPNVHQMRIDYTSIVFTLPKFSNRNVTVPCHTHCSPSSDFYPWFIEPTLDVSKHTLKSVQLFALPCRW